MKRFTRTCLVTLIVLSLVVTSGASGASRLGETQIRTNTASAGGSAVSQPARGGIDDDSARAGRWEREMTIDLDYGVFFFDVDDSNELILNYTAQHEETGRLETYMIPSNMIGHAEIIEWRGREFTATSPGAPDLAFTGAYSGVTTVDIPDKVPATVSTMGEGAVTSGSLITAENLVIGDGVTTLDTDSLYCYVTDLWLPESIEFVDENAISWAGTERVHFGGSKEQWLAAGGTEPDAEAGQPQMIYDAPYDSGSSVPEYSEFTVTEVASNTIPNSVTLLTIPDSVTTVGDIFVGDGWQGNENGTDIIFDGTAEDWFTSVAPTCPDIPGMYNIALLCAPGGTPTGTTMVFTTDSVEAGLESELEYYITNLENADSDAMLYDAVWTSDVGEVSPPNAAVCKGCQRGRLRFAAPDVESDTAATITVSDADKVLAQGTVTVIAPEPIPTPTPEPTAEPTATAEVTAAPEEPTATETPAPTTAPPSPSAAETPSGTASASQTATQTPSRPTNTPSAVQPTPGVQYPGPPSVEDQPAAMPSSASSPSASGSPTESASSEPSALPTVAPVEIIPDDANVPDSVQVIRDPDNADESILVGADIGSLWNATTAGTLTSWIVNPDTDGTVRVVDTEGKVVPPSAQIATGMVVEVLSPDNQLIQETTVVIKGDLTGSGEIDLTQVVRMAQAFVGTDPLHGPYALAADMNDDGRLTITDIVQLAKQYRSGQLNVEYSVADHDETEVLEEAGYDIAPWSDELAVFSAEIPKGAEIESVAWTQHDVFPDGREQMLYYEGPEESLIFGTYDTGRTTVTTVVTTAAGKTGTTQREITWEPGRKGRVTEEPEITTYSLAALSEYAALAYSAGTEASPSTGTDFAKASSSAVPEASTGAGARPSGTNPAGPVITPSPTPVTAAESSRTPSPSASHGAAGTSAAVNTQQPSSSRPAGTSSPVHVPTTTSTHSPSASVTPSPTITAEATNTKQPQPSASPGSDRTSSPVPASTHTQQPSSSASASPTRTGVPTSTRTPLPSAPPSSDRTSSPAPASTHTQRPSSSASASPTRTGAPTSTRTPLPSASPGSAGTSSPVPSPTAAGSGVGDSQEVLELMIPTFRSESFEACNSLRYKNHVQPALDTSKDLASAAQVRAQEMANVGKLSHTRPDGSKYSTVVTLGHGVVVGENIHCNRGYPVPDVAKVASTGWENSAPHRKQMLEPRYSYTGLGFAISSNGTWYCVQLFSNGDDVLSIDDPKG